MPLTRTQGFWPTFRGAVDWMQKHQDIVETALNLIEIYPKLIQHKSCDRMWEFISKTAFYQKKELFSRNNKPGSKTKDKAETVTEANEIPKISITETKDSTNIIRNVYFCGNTMDENWQSFVTGLSNKFFVGSCKGKALSASETETETILSADYFIFAIEDKTINEPYYLNQLHTALTWRIPVTFVRDPSFVIPDPMPDSVFKTSDSSGCSTQLDHEASITPTTSKKETKTKYYRQETRALSEGQIDKEIKSQYLKTRSASNTIKSSRPISPYSQYSSDSSMSLNLPPIPLSLSQTSVSELRKSHSVSSYLSESGQENSLKDSETSAVDKTSRKNPQDSATGSLTRAGYVNGLNDSETISVDTTLPKNKVVSFSEFLTRGYDTAVLYHRLYHHECLDRIAAVLKDEALSSDTAWSKVSDLEQTKQGQSDLKTEKASIDKDECDGPDIEPVACSKPELTKETKQERNNKKRVSMESNIIPNRKLSSPIETFYVVYSDSKDGPEIVHWPVREHREVSGSPSLESFGFQDVDLSLNVNIDLSSSEES